MEDFRRLAARYDCEYVLIDPLKLWFGARYIAGVSLSRTSPSQGTAAWFLCNPDEGVLTSIPGFELLYRTPPARRKSLLYDFRVFRVRY